MYNIAKKSARLFHSLLKPLGFLCYLSIILFILGVWCYNNAYYHFTSADSTIIIPKGSSVSHIGDFLKEKKIIHNNWLFDILARLYALNGKKLKAGEYQFSKGMNMIQVLEKIAAGIIVNHKITIPEGYTVKQVVSLLLNEPSINSSSYIPKVISLTFPEGSIMPDTYIYHYGLSLFAVLEIMHKEMEKFLNKEWEKRDHKIDSVINDKDEALILASIIEKEALFDEEKDKIAGVYINRLKKKMLLQADPTVIYGLTKGEGIFDRRVLFRDLKHDSEYNTYLNLGLPPTPICNPGRASIIAALHPSWNDQLYFVADGTGKHLFASNFFTHKQNIKNIRK